MATRTARVFVLGSIRHIFGTRPLPEWPVTEGADAEARLRALAGAVDAIAVAAAEKVQALTLDPSDPASVDAVAQAEAVAREARTEADRVGAEVDRFVKTCQALGRALARESRVVITGGGSALDVDPHVIAGMIEGQVELAWPKEERIFDREVDRTAYVRLLDVDRPKRVQFTQRVSPGGWTATHGRELIHADAFVLIGGGTTTLGIAHVALALRKPIVAIPSFGGAADQVFDAAVAKASPGLSEDDIWLLRSVEPWGDAHEAAFNRVLSHLIVWPDPRRLILSYEAGHLALALVLVGLVDGAIATEAAATASGLLSRLASLCPSAHAGALIGASLAGSTLSHFARYASRPAPVAALLRSMNLGLLTSIGLWLLLYFSGSAIAPDAAPTAVAVAVAGFSGGFLRDRALDALTAQLAGRLPGAKPAAA